MRLYREAPCLFRGVLQGASAASGALRASSGIRAGKALQWKKLRYARMGGMPNSQKAPVVLMVLILQYTFVNPFLSSFLFDSLIQP
jgi:hypothetical protein